MEDLTYERIRAWLVLQRGILDAAIEAMDALVSRQAEPVRQESKVPTEGIRLQRIEPPVQVENVTVDAPILRRKHLPEIVEPKTVVASQNGHGRPPGVPWPETGAREEAILAALKRSGGMAIAKALRASMPVEPNLTPTQRIDAYANTMTKLKARGLVARTGETWSLIEQGSDSE